MQHLDHRPIFEALVRLFGIRPSPMDILGGSDSHLVGSLDLEHRPVNLVA
jgi:hypothetical protein